MRAFGFWQILCFSQEPRPIGECFWWKNICPPGSLSPILEKSQQNPQDFAAVQGKELSQRWMDFSKIIRYNRA
jgi:hypothetical protein